MHWQGHTDETDRSSISILRVSCFASKRVRPLIHASARLKIAQPAWLKSLLFTAVKSIQYRAVCFHEIYTVAPVVASVVLTFTHSIGPGPYTCTGRLGPCG
jgi:hypothetical protein